MASVPFFQTLVLKTEEASEPPREPVKTQMAGPTRRASHSVGPGWGPSICISNNFQVLLILVLGPHFENQFPRQFWITAIKPSLLRKPQSRPFTATLMCRQQGILYTSPWPCGRSHVQNHATCFWCSHASLADTALCHRANRVLQLVGAGQPEWACPDRVLEILHLPHVAGWVNGPPHLTVVEV